MNFVGEPAEDKLNIPPVSCTIRNGRVENEICFKNMTSYATNFLRVLSEVENKWREIQEEKSRRRLCTSADDVVWDGAAPLINSLLRNAPQILFLWATQHGTSQP
ncbi:unnamed protein product [Rotaria magnacalcarata]|uniref:Uncharacterized protein n=1 Tax=Rotaria magnacalcarata TaxID=392030 RepID=A0A815U3I4_9BILA|nr:unnamed protein product [Rotaria magnacalcarata]CAF5043169.1 unnamed protein product [Rotaria magnacalcarata]